MRWLEDWKYNRDRRMVAAKVATHRALHRWEASEEKWLGKERRNGMRAEVFRGKDGEYRFKVIADNNEPVAQSEGYKNRADAAHIAADLVGEENVGLEQEQLEEDR